MCLDELLVRQRRRPVPVGVLLGVLMALQLLVGTEVLAIVAVTAGIAAVLLALGALLRLDRVRGRLRYGGIGSGRRGYVGAPVGLPDLVHAGRPGASLRWDLGSPLGDQPVRHHARAAHLAVCALGPAPRLGPPVRWLPGADPLRRLLRDRAVRRAGSGVLVWHRDRRLWFFGAIGVLSAWLALGVQEGHWTPWRLFAGLPQLDNVIPSRFLLVTYLSAAVMLGLIVDHTHRAVGRRVSSAAGPRVQRSCRAVLGRSAGRSPVAAVGLVPIAVYYGQGLPLTVQPVVVPTWFRTVAPGLAPGQVALVFPVPFAYYQSAMTWQATSGMTFAMVGGGGPGALPSRAGTERAGQVAIGNLSVSETPQTVTAAEITATRDALDGWGVTLGGAPPIPSRSPSTSGSTWCATSSC